MTRLHIYAVLVGGVFMLSTSGIFARISSAPPVITAFYRLFFASLVLWPALLIRKATREEFFSITKESLALCIAGGFFLAIHYSMWFFSVQLTSVSSATILASLQPLFSMIIGWVAIREKITKKSLFGAAIALAGTTIIGWGDFRTDSNALIGDIIALSSAGLISLYYFFGQLACKKISNSTFATLGYTSSVVTLFVLAIIIHAPFSGYPTATWGSFLGLAYISTIGGQMVLTSLLKHITATMVTMSILGEPIGVCILAAIFLKEYPTIQILVGMPVILVGLFIFFNGQTK